jgi:hypothetical protein
MISGDASTSITLGWNQMSGENVQLHLQWGDKPFVHVADILKDNTYKGMDNFFIRLTELRPDKKYQFKIVDSEGTSKIYWFQTAPTDHSSLSFIAGGDSRSRRDARSKANVMVSKLRPHAVLFNGDMTTQDIDKEWVQWFQDWEKTIDSSNHIVPLIVSRGNHEHSNQTLTNLFAVPHKKVYYDAQFGTDFINIITLNSEILKFGSQKWFLRKSLKEHQHFTWQLPQYHRPNRPHVSWKKEMNNQCRHFVTQFEEYKNVKLALECDAHTCKTTYPIVLSKDKDAHEGFKRDDKNGIVYIGEGCWGAPLREPNDPKPWTKSSEAIDSFKWIFIKEDSLEVRVVKYSNSAEVISDPKNKFEIPEKIDLWSPNGESVTIIKK